MSGDDAPQRTTPWWETQLPAIAADLRDVVRRRLPGLPAHHDDLVNESLAGLSERILRHPERVPASWHAPVAPARDEERDYLGKLAATILRRRIADLFRARAQGWGHAVSLDDGGAGGFDGAAAPAAPTPSAERQALLARMLRVCVGVLADLSQEDRELLGNAAGLEGPGEPDDAPARPLTDRERQRLRRARARLLEEIRRQLGADAADLLRSED